MEALSIPRLIWTANRWVLTKGPVAWIGLVGGAIALIMGIAVMLSLARLSRAEQALAEQIKEASAPRSASTEQRSLAPPFPKVEQRFDVTARILAAISESELEPEQIQFKFETSQDAGFTRQIAVFTLQAEWDQLSRALQLLQAADRSIYISRLRLVRESASQATVSAEVQLAVAFLDPSLGQGRPL